MTATVATRTTTTTSNYEDDDTKASAGNRNSRVLSLVDCGGPKTLILGSPSSPLIIRVPSFLLFGFNKGTQKEKG